MSLNIVGMKIKFALVERFLDGPLIGFTYFPKDEVQDFNELNLYLIFIVLHFKIYNNE